MKSTWLWPSYPCQDLLNFNNLVKNPPAVWETWIWSLGWEEPLEKGKATHSSILAWRIPWTHSPLNCKESDMTEWLSLTYHWFIHSFFHFVSIDWALTKCQGLEIQNKTLKVPFQMHIFSGDPKSLVQQTHLASILRKAVSHYSVGKQYFVSITWRCFKISGKLELICRVEGNIHQNFHNRHLW